MSDINSPATPAAQDSRTSARLEAGLTAPDFTLPSDNGGSVTLSHCAAKISSYTSTLPR